MYDASIQDDTWAREEIRKLLHEIDVASDNCKEWAKANWKKVSPTVSN